jgi:hypothetical protein
VQDCEELGEWLSEHGALLTAKEERPGLTVELQYRPAACAACAEDRDGRFEDPALRKRVMELKGAELYVLHWSVSSTAPDSLSSLWNEGLQEDLFEVVGLDTLPCAFMHMEAMPAMLPYRSALIGFDRVQDGKDRRILLRDSGKRLGGDIILEFIEGGLQRYAVDVPDSLTSGRS